MSYEETTSTGWLARIGDSLKGMLFALLLIPIAIVLLVFNERNAVQDISANDEIAKVVVSVTSDAVNPAHEGKLVHLNGKTKTDDVLKNEQFGISKNAVRLSWQTQIYQWEETKSSKSQKKLGGGEETVTTYDYTQKWSDEVIDSSGFKEKGHVNSGRQNFSKGEELAENVRLGAFKLPSGLVSQIHAKQHLSIVDLPAPLANKGRIADGVYYTGDPSAPKIGDEKVEFFYTPAGDVSVMAVQSGNSFVPYVTKCGKEKFLLYEGLMSAQSIVKSEENKAALIRWVLRVLGVVLMWVGFILLSKPLSIVADVVPFLGTCVEFLTGGFALLLSVGISLTIIALSWLAFRPILGIGVLALAVGCGVLIVKMRAKKTLGTAIA